MTLRPMEARDIPAVVALEAASFETGWSATAFARELTQNAMARYLVLEEGGRLVGFAGLWLMVDEAHVVTVAVDPPERGRGFGKLLVRGLIALAVERDMELATLEVRVSNAAARALYGSFGFYEVGMRHKYYQDNGEDAVIMTTEAFASDAYQRRLARIDATLEARFPGVRLAGVGTTAGS